MATLTGAQLQTLATAIASDPLLNNLPHDSDGAALVVNNMNQAGSPVFWVWRTSVSKREMVGSVSVDGTTFTWAGNGFITRSAGELTAWQELFDTEGNVNPSLTNVRQAFTDIFSGTGNAASNRTHLAATGRRTASKFEKLYTTGTGTTASPGLLGVEGPVTVDNVILCWGI